MKLKYPTQSQEEKEKRIKPLRQPKRLYWRILGRTAGKNAAYMCVAYVVLNYLLHEPEPEKTDLFTSLFSNTKPEAMIKGWFLEMLKYLMAYIWLHWTIKKTRKDYSATVNIAKDITHPYTHKDLKGTSWKIVVQHQVEHSPEIARQMIIKVANGGAINNDIFKQVTETFVENNPDGLDFLKQYFDDIPQHLIDIYQMAFGNQRS